MHRRLEDIRTEGPAALHAHLGKAGMIRFLQQFDTGHGDYTEERREWVEKTTLDELERAAKPRRRSKRSPS